VDIRNKNQIIAVSIIAAVICGGLILYSNISGALDKPLQNNSTGPGVWRNIFTDSEGTTINLLE
jgi:hypothetical protein